MISIRELKETGTFPCEYDEYSSEIPEEFLDVLPDYCDCGAEYEINETLTRVSCSDRQCPRKVARRLEALLQDLGVKNMGISMCTRFLANFETNSPLAIFMYNPDEDGCLTENTSMAVSKTIFQQIDERRRMTLAEYVRLANLQGIQGTALKLFKDYTDLESFYADLELDGVDLIYELLNMSRSKISLTALQVYDELLFAKEELLAYIDAVDIIVPSKTLTICISTSVGAPYTSKPDFIAKVNDEFGDRVHINYSKSWTSGCDYLIWSGMGTPTSKVTKAQSAGVPILTGSEFTAMLRETF